MNWNPADIIVVAFAICLLMAIFCFIMSIHSRRKPNPPPSINHGELTPLARGECPDCGSTEFYQGPEGGICVNVACCECGSKFNIGFVGGVLLHAERI